MKLFELTIPATTNNLPTLQEPLAMGQLIEGQGKFGKAQLRIRAIEQPSNAHPASYLLQVSTQDQPCYFTTSPDGFIQIAYGQKLFKAPVTDCLELSKEFELQLPADAPTTGLQLGSIISGQGAQGNYDLQVSVPATSTPIGVIVRVRPRKANCPYSSTPNGFTALVYSGQTVGVTYCLQLGKEFLLTLAAEIPGPTPNSNPVPVPLQGLQMGTIITGTGPSGLSSLRIFHMEAPGMFQEPGAVLHVQAVDPACPYSSTPNGFTAVQYGQNVVPVVKCSELG